MGKVRISSEFSEDFRVQVVAHQDFIHGLLFILTLVSMKQVFKSGYP